MCIIHKGFSGFRALSPASFLVGKLIGLNPAIPYVIIHSPLYASLHDFITYLNKFWINCLLLFEIKYYKT
jgi:hypothetical protein